MGAAETADDQKKAIEEGRTLVYVDESGFYLLPSGVRTWAVRGNTPVLRSPLSREHLSVISALSEDGRLLMQVRDHSLKAHDCIGFLKHLVRHLGKVLVVWDCASIHRSELIKEYLHSQSQAQVHLASLPGYAPEVNPDEGVWRYLKQVELRNLCCGTLKRLRYELVCAVKHLRQKTDVLRSFLRHALPFSYQ